MDVKIGPSIMENVIVIGVDSSGIKVANRGEWMRKKWHVSGFIKMRIAVDKGSKGIIAMRVTKHVHDDKNMISMIRSVEER